jgi:hypothetical protein
LRFNALTQAIEGGNGPGQQFGVRWHLCCAARLAGIVARTLRQGVVAAAGQVEPGKWGKWRAGREGEGCNTLIFTRQ